MAKKEGKACPVRLEDLQRLLRHVKKTKKGCWQWKASSGGRGYGQVTIRGKVRLAHRVFYEIFSGEIPEGLVLDHLCRNRGCVNPDHLEAVTQAENLRRCMPRGKRHWCGAKTHCKRGHPLSGDNLRTAHDADGRPYRQCKKCLALAQRRYRARKKRREAKARAAAQ